MIYKLKQNRVSRTYKGGSRIDKFTQEVFVKKGMYPEDWTASATAVKNSSGMTEGIGITENGEKITDIIGNDILPILVKLLDADERLVIQVHPTVNFSQRYLNSSFGKTECWYFLDCSPDAHIYLGFKPDITIERWRKAIQNENSKELLDMLWHIPVHKGDFVFVDGGMPCVRCRANGQIYLRFTLRKCIMQSGPQICCCRSAERTRYNMWQGLKTR